MLSPLQAKYLLGLLKGRTLVMLDAERAHSPFPYDKKFFDKLRPDQVPRFLRCLTDPEKLPKQWISLDKLSALQDRVEVAKVESIRSAPTDKPPVVVRIRGDHDTIADGLHRSTANWLDGMQQMVVYYCDLTDKTQEVEPVPGAGEFEREARHASLRMLDGSEK